MRLRRSRQESAGGKRAELGQLLRSGATPKARARHCPRSRGPAGGARAQTRLETRSGVPPGGARGGPGVSGAWRTDGQTDRPTDWVPAGIRAPWRSPPRAVAAWAGTSARSRYSAPRPWGRGSGTPALPEAGAPPARRGARWPRGRRPEPLGRARRGAGGRAALHAPAGGRSKLAVNVKWAQCPVDFACPWLALACPGLQTWDCWPSEVCAAE